MRILFIHNEYQIRGGEDSVLENEIKLLQDNGHEVFLYKTSNKSIKNIFHKVKTFLNIHYSYSSRNKIKNFINEIRPGIVHVHNFFPLITPSVFDACIENNIPVIHTLHNFRLICPSGILMHKNNIDYIENKCTKMEYQKFFLKKMQAFPVLNN